MFLYFNWTKCADICCKLNSHIIYNKINNNNTNTNSGINWCNHYKFTVETCEVFDWLFSRLHDCGCSQYAALSEALNMSLWKWDHNRTWGIKYMKVCVCVGLQSVVNFNDQNEGKGERERHKNQWTSKTRQGKMNRYMASASAFDTVAVAECWMLCVYPPAAVCHPSTLV